jgi:hypothetical protein
MPVQPIPYSLDPSLEFLAVFRVHFLSGSPYTVSSAKILRVKQASIDPDIVDNLARGFNNQPVNSGMPG